MDQLNINQNKFENIFAGREDGYGYWDKRFNKDGFKPDGRKDCKSKEDQQLNFETHLNGTLTQGHSPINRAKGGVRYLVIDFDKKIECETITKAIWKISSQLTCVMSLSGRWHIYFHFDNWTNLEKGKKARDKLIEKIRKLPFVEEKDVDEDHSLPGDVADQYWCFLPYSTEIQKCYTTWGETLSKEQYEYRFKFRKHPLIVAAIGQVSGRRHKALFNVGVYLKHNKLDTDLYELNKNFNPPLPADPADPRNDEVAHQLDSANKEKYDLNHLKRNLPFWIDNLSKVKHFAEMKEVDLPEDLPDALLDPKPYEDYAFNNEPGATVNEPGQTEQIELVGYDMKEYRKLDIPPKSFIIDNLLFDKSFNFIVGPKGTGKSEWVIAMCIAMTRGHPFLGRKIETCHPVVYVDAEMYPTDPIDREKPYLERWGEHPDNYFHMLNFSFQDKQQFPDLQTERMQQGLRNYLKKVEKLTGKKPLLVLDNLRSLSAYKENDSDAWYPMGKFLFKLRGLGFPSIVIDHMGKMSPGPRGSSSKTDWADLVLVLTPEKEKGNKNMKVKIVFDKARGLRPENTDEFFAEYNFRGEWNVAEGKKELDLEETFIAIDKIISEWKISRMKLYPLLKPTEELDLKRSGKLKEYYQNRFPRGVKTPTQQHIADKIGCSTGKMNSLMKKFDKWQDEQSANGGQGYVPF